METKGGGKEVLATNVQKIFSLAVAVATLTVKVKQILELREPLKECPRSDLEGHQDSDPPCINTKSSANNTAR